jgi:predicted transcriptional regulator
MKTAISISDDIFTQAERVAKQLGLSRSKLYSQAILEFVKNHYPDTITTKLNEVYGKQDSGVDDDIIQTNFDLLSQDEW